MHCQGAGLEARQQRLELTLIWDSSALGSILLCCATTDFNNDAEITGGGGMWNSIVEKLYIPHYLPGNKAQTGSETCPKSPSNGWWNQNSRQACEFHGFSLNHNGRLLEEG